MSAGDYVVEVKRSARRTNGRAGEWVNREGPRRRFASKSLARGWARDISRPDARVWIQDAVPADPAPVDGYLVGGRRPGGRGGGEHEGAGARQVSLDEECGRADGGVRPRE